MSFTHFLIVYSLVPPLPHLLFLKLISRKLLVLEKSAAFLWRELFRLGCHVLFDFAKVQWCAWAKDRYTYTQTDRQTELRDSRNRQAESIRKWCCPQGESLSGNFLLSKEKYQVFSVIHENQNSLGRDLSHHSICLERTRTPVWHSLSTFVEKLGTGAQACHPSTGEMALWTAILVYLASSRPVREPVMAFEEQYQGCPLV